MKHNNQRIKSTEEKDKFILEINSFKENDKQKFFSVWLGAFLISGIAIISQLFTNENSELKLMIFVFAIFWGYFSYKMIRTWRWRNSGKEVLEFTDEYLMLGKRYGERGLLKPYAIEKVSAPRKFNNESNDFVKSINESYWMISNEQLCFNFGSKIILFGHRLSDAEAKKVLKIVDTQLKKRKQSTPES
jgi:hypothetical protein